MARILIIEDNEQSRELMSYLLEAFGHEVSTARDGEEALATLEETTFDLVVCDVHLPRMDGYQVVKHIKGYERLAPTPVVAVTALAMVGDRDRLLGAGFDSYISKPIDPQLFVPQIEALLPAVRPQAATSDVAESAPAADTKPPTEVPARARILVIDDVPQNCELTRAILEPSGYDVTVCNNVRRALSALHEQRFDLILCDLRMDDCDGLELLATIKGNPELRTIPFMFITASRWIDSERARARQLGVTQFLLRPIEPRELLAEIAAALGRAES